MRVIAVDWSGAKKPGKKIWTAEYKNGKPAVLRNGFNREEVVAYLSSLVKQASPIIVGLDFAFSFPGWYLRLNKLSDVKLLWSEVAGNGERWLRDCPDPFFGPKGRKCGLGKTDLFRKTELNASRSFRVFPKSVFQLAGGGHVGTGTIRGIPFLSALQESGYSIWPFGQSSSFLVIEIYPRLLTGAVNKGHRNSRQGFLLRSEFMELPSEWIDQAIESEDAFDASISALRMNQYCDRILALKRSSDPDILLEGMIWNPSVT